MAIAFDPGAAAKLWEAVQNYGLPRGEGLHASSGPSAAPADLVRAFDALMSEPPAKPANTEIVSGIRMDASVNAPQGASPAASSDLAVDGIQSGSVESFPSPMELLGLNFHLSFGSMQVFTLNSVKNTAATDFEQLLKSSS